MYTPMFWAAARSGDSCPPECSSLAVVRIVSLVTSRPSTRRRSEMNRAETHERSVGGGGYH